jgi:hypothetical protein
MHLSSQCFNRKQAHAHYTGADHAVRAHWKIADSTPPSAKWFDHLKEVKQVKKNKKPHAITIPVTAVMMMGSNFCGLQSRIRGSSAYAEGGETQ